MAYNLVPLARPWDIRLLQIMPGADHEMIACNQRVFSVAEPPNRQSPAQRPPVSGPPRYFALSYTWGDTSVTYPILLNGERTEIRENLYQFLTTWRRAGTDDTLLHPLWIDALCINQDDFQERNHQVRRMKAIYEEAYQVVIWLGPAADDSNLALNKICSIYEQYFSIRGQLVGRDTPIKEASELALETLVREDVAPVVITQRLPAPNDGDPWPALRKFFQRPWWSRVWIVQEATTKVETSLFCGGYTISWNQIVIAVTVLHRLMDQPFFVSLQKKDIVSVIKLTLFRSNREKLAQRYMGLIEVLQSFSLWNATDERDKIFAALPLASDYNASWAVQIDYSKKLCEIFTEVTKQFIACSVAYGHRLDILAVKPEEDVWHDFPALDSKLPSWVPDLRRCRTAREPLQKYLSKTIDSGFNKGENLAYSASGRSLTSTIRRFVTFPLTRISGDSLFITGFGISTISEWVGAVPTSLPGQLGVDAIDEYAWRPTNPTDLYFTGETMNEAYLRTIVADVGYGPNESYTRGNSMKFLRTKGETKVTLGPVPSGDENFTLLKGATERRMFIYTVNGLMGLVPAGAKLGDQIFVVLESQVLHVLRPVSTHYQYIGECYIHGHMDGKVLAVVPYLRQFRRLEVR